MWPSLELNLSSYILTTVRASSGWQDSCKGSYTWLWLSWQCSNLWHLRSAVRIQSLSNFWIQYFSPVNCVQKTKLVKKRLNLRKKFEHWSVFNKGGSIIFCQIKLEVLNKLLPLKQSTLMPWLSSKSTQRCTYQQNGLITRWVRLYYKNHFSWCASYYLLSLNGK